MSRRFDLRDERGDMVLKHVIVLGIVVAIVVFLVVEVGPLLWTRISMMQEAQDVADGVALSYRLTGSEATAVARGAEMMMNQGYSEQDKVIGGVTRNEIRDSTILFLPPTSPKKTDVQVTLVRYYDNLITKIPWFKNFGRISCTKTANITTAQQK